MSDPTEAELAVAAAALAGLPKMSFGRLRALLAAAPAAAAWAGVSADTGFVARALDGDNASLARDWASAARRVDLAAIARAHQAAGVAVRVVGDAGYPSVLAADHEAPAVLFTRGDVGALTRPTVAVVGTRSATHYGEDVAADLGRALARAGVAVLSGLALGIDAAAHRGALAAAEAPPIGVVGSGLDVVYPPRHARLWERVATAGALLSEAPLGAAPEAWRFPARNRIIAAIAHVVVVVECHRRGGALHTVEAAVERGRPVMAVPGAVRSPASEGTNALLADGCQPARDVDDVLAALDLERAGCAASRRASRRPDLTQAEGAVVSAVDWQPTGTDEVMRRTGMDLEMVAVILDQLDETGLVRRGDGWWERASTGAGLPAKDSATPEGRPDRPEIVGGARRSRRLRA
jgi:DNA processing protein